MVRKNRFVSLPCVLWDTVKKRNPPVIPQWQQVSAMIFNNIGGPDLYLTKRR